MNIAAPLQENQEELVEVSLPDRVVTENAKAILDRVLLQAEKDERDLAYYTPCKSEQARKQSGSYYTPVDVARFFWSQFFDASDISSPEQATAFVRTHRLIEPSCGSGVLVYALLGKLLNLGVPLDAMRDFDLHLVDFNVSALDYARRQFALINAALGADYFMPSFEHTDFLTYEGVKSSRPVIIFGNPPFVSNPKGATWKNTYADFLDRCLEVAAPLAAVHFIVPLSLAFSRDYAALRNKLSSGRFAVYASHFDNIPDTLFKSGKPQSDNSNKANSQRCTIISAFAKKEYRLYSSPLYSWSKSERAAFLSRRTEFYDVTEYRMSDQFIRPSSKSMAHYLQHQQFAYRLRDLPDERGIHAIHIGSVARNYISVRGEPGSGVQTFYFNDRDSFYRFLGVVASDVFIEYWRSVGDGFHVTRSNILDFPLSADLVTLVDASIPRIRTMWARRQSCEKTKLNSGTIVRSYDFSAAAPSYSLALTR